MVLVLLYIPDVRAQFTIDIESGLAFPGYNVVRIPNEGGTLFSFQKDFEASSPVIPWRIRVGHAFNERNHIFALYAPLSIPYTGTAPRDIDFQSSTFRQGTNLTGWYTFNSYRLTYRRDIAHSNDWLLGIGFTAKIRDARIRLADDRGRDDRKDDLGFVPLLHLYAAYDFGAGKLLYFEGDGLAGGPGHAFDLFLGTRIALSDRIAVKAGYRLLEGGADVEEVYNFTLVQFAVGGVFLRF